MVAPFIYQASPVRVLFGRGTLALLADEADRLGVGRALVLSTSQQSELARRAAEILGARTAGIFSEAAMHTPLELTEQAVALAREIGADATVAVGGGSTTGLGKAIARRIGIRQIAVPTTYAGSEMTSILGETANGSKVTIRDPALFPTSVIYDVNLTLGLPAGLSATSGLNAIAHAVEALYAHDGNPVVSALAELSIGRFADALPRLVREPGDIAARESALIGAWLAGICLGSCAMSVHHKLCHVLGGTFDLPHAETHAVILPHALAFVADAVPAACETIERALKADDAASGLYELARAAGAPLSLQAIGMPLSGITEAAEAAASDQYPSPRPLDTASMYDLLLRAYNGAPPPRRR